MIRRPPRSTLSSSSAASDVYKRQDNGYILDSLGWVYFHMGELEKARIEMEHAVSLEPDDPYILEHMGDIYQKSGFKEKARDSYRRAKKLFKEQKMKENMPKKNDEIK